MLAAMTAWRTHPKGLSYRKGNSRVSTPPASASSASVTEQATLSPGKVANFNSTYIQQMKRIAFSLRNWSC